MLVCEDDLPSCSKTNPGSNEVIKERRRPSTKPYVKDLWPPNNNATKLNEDTTLLRPINSESVVNSLSFQGPKEHDTTIDLKTSLLNNDVEMSSDDDEIQHNFAKMSKAFAKETKEVSDDDDDQAMQTNFNEREESSDEDDDGNFKIHFAQTSRDPMDLSTDDFDDDQDEAETLPDETSYQTMSTLTYSSQAESIFFGAEEKPVARPRNFVFTGKDNDDDDDNKSEGSSASA